MKDHYDISKEGIEKTFRFRESLLSLKFKFPDYKTIYNMMCASFIILTFSLFYDSYTSKGSIIDLVAFNNFFKGWQTVFLCWWILAIIHFSVIIVVSIALKTTAIVWMPLYILHQASLFGFAVWCIITNQLGFASVFVIACESIRMVMKSHSYFRTKLLYLKENEYKNYNPYEGKAQSEKDKKEL